MRVSAAALALVLGGACSSPTPPTFPVAPAIRAESSPRHRPRPRASRSRFTHTTLKAWEPADTPSCRDGAGKATWYASPYGSRSTAAPVFIPKGTRLRVWRGSRSVVVTVRDAGPALSAQRKGKCLDLDRSAFAALAPLSTGVIRVHWERA